MKSAKSYSVTIMVGFREGYSGMVHTLAEAEKICQKYCNNVGLCVTVTPTKFIYKDGNEKGCAIGLINYPRFPSYPDKIRKMAFEIAIEFMNEFKQNRISIVAPDVTYMIEANKDTEL